MKKLFLILIASFTCALHAGVGQDQFSLSIGLSTGQTYAKALEICQERGFSHFMFKRIFYTDALGQSLEFKGVCTDLNGELISDSIIQQQEAPLGKQKVDFEIICFKSPPKDVLATDVQGLLDFVAMCQQEPVLDVAGSKVWEITTLDELKREIASSDGSVYVDCYSTHCPPCKMLAPKFDQYSQDLSSKGTFLKINLDTAPEVASQYEIRAIPTLLIFKDKKELDRKSSFPEILKYFEGLKS